MSESLHKKDKSKSRQKSNKSSIVRVIVSNFDDHCIKEIKVLYLKQGGVDTFLIDNDQMLVGYGMNNVTSGPINFGDHVKAVKSVLFNDPTQRYQPPKVTINNGDIYVSKTTGHGSNEPYKHYVISGKWRFVKDKEINSSNKTSESKIEVKVTVTDLINNKSYLSKEENQRRRAESHTYRILLSQEVMKNYSYILNDSSKVNATTVDSINIHRANTFLEYRSQMLYYFTFINHFFMNLDKIVRPLADEKIEKLSDETEKVEALNKYKIMFDELENFRNKCNGNLYLVAKIDTSNVNTNHSDPHYQYKIKATYEAYISYIAKALCLLKNNWLENYQIYLKSEKNINNKNTDSFIETIKNFVYEESEIQEDIEKILCELTAFRHALAHYDYQLFDSLYRNPFEMNTDKVPSIFKQLNDLKLFSLLQLLPVAKMAQKHPYIDKDDYIYIMEQMIPLRECAYLYDLMGAQKEGFKATINDFFCLDGVTNPNVQTLIKDSIETEIDALEKITKNPSKKINMADITNRLEVLNNRLNHNSSPDSCDDNDTPLFYYEDIHCSREYKDIYNDHKELKLKLNKALVNNNPDNININDCNQKLHEYNTQMLALTKENAKIRLEARVRLAFGLIYSNYNWNIPSFKEQFNCAIDKFNTSIQSEIKESYTLYTNADQKRTPLKKYFECSIMSRKTKVNNKDRYFHIKDITNNFNNINSSEMNLFNTNSQNNLFKFYTLIALFLPKEFKGDFLGFAKKHYYDSKNIVDYHELNLQGKESEFEKHDTFFHHIRLFSKQIKSYDLFKYTFDQVIDQDTLKPLIENAVNYMTTHNRINTLTSKQMQVLNTFISEQHLPIQMVKPLMSFYKLIGHLSNQFEMRLLIQYAKKNNIISLHDAFNSIKKPEKPLLFKPLIEKIYVDVYKDNIDYPQFTIGEKKFLNHYAPKLVNTRNTVMHMKLKELLRDNVCDPVAFEDLHQGIFDMLKLYTLFDLQNIEMGTDVINQYLNAYDQLVSQLVLKPNYRITKQQTQENNTEPQNPKLHELLRSYYQLAPYITNKETLIDALKTGDSIPKQLETFNVKYTKIDEHGKEKKFEVSLSDLQKDENKDLMNSDTLDFDKISGQIKTYCSNEIEKLRSLIQQNFSLYIAKLLSQLKISRDIFTIKDYTDFNKDSNKPIKIYKYELILCANNRHEISNPLPNDLKNNINLKPQKHQTSSKTYLIHYPRDKK